MERSHTVAYLERDVQRERARADFLESALRNYADHAWNDLKNVLERDYPRAIHTGLRDGDVDESLHYKGWRKDD